jgi:hypothetical protein
MRFTGNILRNGTVIFAGISGTMQTTQSVGVEETTGHFTLPQGKSIDPGDYELQLPDRIGDIIVLAAVHALQGPAFVNFELNGDWR